MGIDGLSKFLRSKYPQVYSQVHISKFTFKKICFDISSYIYTNLWYELRTRARLIEKGGCSKEEINQKFWLNKFIEMIFAFKRYAVDVIPIFDGKPPIEKAEERSDRQNERKKNIDKCDQLKADILQFETIGHKSLNLLQTMSKLTTTKEKQLLEVEEMEIDIKKIKIHLTNRETNNVNIDEKDIILLKSLFDQFKIPYFQAKDEAEALCNYMVNNKLADATFSLDSDCVAYKVPILINDFDIETGMCQVIYFSDICKSLELKPDQVTLLLILCKCDYNRHTAIKGIGPANALKMIKKWETYEQIKKNEKKFHVADDGYRVARCFELFNLAYPEINRVATWNYNIDIKNVCKWLKTNNIRFDKNRLIELWQPLQLVCED